MQGNAAGVWSGSLPRLARFGVVHHETQTASPRRTSRLKAQTALCLTSSWPELLAPDDNRFALARATIGPAAYIVIRHHRSADDGAARVQVSLYHAASVEQSCSGSAERHHRCRA